MNSRIIPALMLLWFLTGCNGIFEVGIEHSPAGTAAVLPTTEAGEVATIVSETLTAFPSASPSPEATIALTSEPPSVLPRSLYYVDKDPSGKYQIYRLGRDGTTVTQITFEPHDPYPDSSSNDWGSFDISPIDGTIIYATGSELIAIDDNGGNLRVLVEDQDLKHISDPIWSPDGQTIAYRYRNDIYLYTFSSRRSSLLLAGGDALSLRPKLFSPDGKKLIILKQAHPGAPEGEFPEIYNFASNSLIHISDWGSNPYPLTCLGNISWITQDSFYCFYQADTAVIMPGLVLVNANDGSSKPLVSRTEISQLIQLVSAPRLDAAGNLFYLYGEHDGVFMQGKPLPTLSLVRSDADGVTNRVVIRPEKFLVRNAMWTPDDSAIVITQNNEKSMPSELLLVPLDPSLPVLTLLPDAASIGQIFCWGP